MTELRLTFASEGFAAVSQVLVAMGLSFHVEPVGKTSEKEVAPAVEAAPAAKGRMAARPARKSPAKAKPTARAQGPSSARDSASPGAERLRAAIAKSGTTYRSLLEPGAGTPEPTAPADDAAGGEQADR